MSEMALLDDLNGSTGGGRAREIEILKLKIKIAKAKESEKISPDDAGPLDIAAEGARGIGKGVEFLVEGTSDILDEVNTFDRVKRGYETYQKGGDAGDVALRSMMPQAVSDYMGIGLDSPRPDETGITEGVREQVWNAATPLTERKIEEGSAPIDMMRTATEWAPSLVNPAAAGKQIAKTVAGGAGGAAVGGEVLGPIGEIIFGITGAIASGNITGAIDGTKNLFKRLAGNSEEQARKKAAEFIAANVDAPAEEFAAKLKTAVDSDDVGTVGQVTDDIGALNTEASAYTPTGSQAIDTSITARAEDIANKAGQTMDSPTTLLPQVQAKLNQNVQQIDQTVDAATVTAQQQANEVAGLSQAKEARAVDANIKAVDADAAAQGKLSTTTPTYEASEQLAKQLDTSEQAYKKTFMNPAWEAFDKLRGKTGMQTGMLKSSIDNYLKTLGATQRKALEAAYGSEFKYINGLNKNARPSEIAFIVSQIKKSTSNAAATNSSSAADKFVSGVTAKLENALLKDPNAKDLYAEAVDLTRKSTEQFRQRGLASTRVSPEVETFGERFIKTGDAGAAAARDMRNSGADAIAKASGYLKSLVARDGATKVWENYEPFLREFPDKQIVAYIDDAARAEARVAKTGARADDVVEAEEKFRSTLPKAVEAATGEARQTSKKLKTSLSNSVMAKFVDEPAVTINNILSKPDSAKRITDLIEYTGDAPAVRSAFKDAIIKRVFKRSGGKTVADSSAVDEFNNMGGALERLFADAPDELAKLTEQINRTKVEDLRKFGRGRKLMDAIGGVEDAVATGAAATVMGNFSGTHQLMFGGAMRRRLISLFGGERPDPRILDAVGELLADPAKLLANLPTPQPKQSMTKYVDDLISSKLSAPMRAAYTSLQDEE